MAVSTGLSAQYTNPRTRAEAAIQSRSSQPIVSTVGATFVQQYLRWLQTPTPAVTAPSADLVADGGPVDERSYRPVEIEIGGHRASVRTGSVRGPRQRLWSR